MHSKAYIFRQQQLLVDEHFQLPQVERLQHDLNLSENGEIIARDLKEDEPCRKVISWFQSGNWCKSGADRSLNRPAVRYSYWNGAVTTAFAVNAVTPPSSMSASMP
jgi:hypothetical protein